jgi:RNA polymerase sigma-70 factor, ECF subfamily
MTDQRVDEEFARVSDRYRRELLAHCYRMLGSVHEAEDLVQETYLRAWRSYHGFEGRSSLRTWLYRIATNACLNALESRGRRPLPTGLGNPSADPSDPLVQQTEVPWLEPAPDAMVGLGPSDPATIVASRESVRLALVAALQELPPRQRAVLVLREVLKMPAAEVAEVLETSTAAVNSSLQRARAQLDQAGLTEDDVVEPAEPDKRELLDRYVQALENKDIPAIIKLFTADAVWEMPPFISWYQTPEHIGHLIATECPAGPGEMRLLPIQANGQPAFAMYILGNDGTWQPFQLQVLTLSAAGISHVAAFFDLSLFPTFGLPETLLADPPTPATPLPADAS